MQALDWIVLITTMIGIVAYGIWKTRKNKGIEDYIKGGSNTKWWTIGLSVMATQASAITFLSTPGQAFNDGMGFVQFYFGVPIAMVIICLVFIPLYHRLNVYTAYEFLEGRFDLKTRTLAAILFLIQRGLAAGITIFAPAIILSAVLGWELPLLILVIGISVILYTVTGGTKAVNVTQKQQMLIIFMGMIITFVIVSQKLPEGINFSNALQIAGASDKMQVLDFSFDLNNRYTFWSGIIGGSFLALSYFGTDQSQVQRYLSGRSVQEMRWGLLFNGLLKVPMQFFILLVGVMVFVFYQFNQAPLSFNPMAAEAVANSQYATEYQNLEEELLLIQKQKKTIGLALAGTAPESEHHFEENFSKSQMAELEVQEKALRSRAGDIIGAADEDIETNDKDYVLLLFVLNNLPRGLIGLLLAVIIFAAMSSTASELNALGTISAIDLYKRNVSEKTEAHYVKVSKTLTLIWGIIAIIFANFASLVENLIQFVNIIGSIFYGNVLGIFLIAFFVRFVRGKAVFWAAIITQVFLFVFFYYAIYSLEQQGEEPLMSFLWLNFVGCIVVMGLAILLQVFMPNREANSLDTADT